MDKRVKEIATQDAEKIKALTKDAVQSGAYLFPIKGIVYFATHRALWKPLLSRLPSTLTLSMGVTVLMFTVAYLPQAAVMAFTSGPLAAFSAALLTLSESSTLINILSRTFLVEDALIDTFDGTLVAKECTSLVSDGREIKGGSDPIAKLGKLIKKPFASFTPTALIRYVMYLPLNFIPVVGTIVFIILQGKRRGPDAHARYFQLKGWSSSQQRDYVQEHRGAYTSFGIAASLLEMVPFANLIFAFTNSVGAALWAASLEQRTQTSTGVRDAAKKAS